MAQAAVDIFCHGCRQRSSSSSTDLVCPRCQSSFVELIEDDGSSVDSITDLYQTSVADHLHDTSMSDNDTLRLLSNSLFNSFPDVNPPDNDDSNPRSYFQIRFQSAPPDAAGSANNDEPSLQPPRARRRFNFRIGRRGNRPGQSTSVEANQPVPLPANLSPHQFMEELVQHVFAGPDRQGGTGSGGGLPWGMFPLHANLGDYAWGSNGIDDIITQLLGQLDNTGAPPATNDAIKKLPIVKITQEHVDKKKDCSICMDIFVVDTEAKELPCEHIFHPDCIDEWLKLHNTCPICRTNVEASQRDPSCPRAPTHTPHNSSGPSTSGV